MTMTVPPNVIVVIGIPDSNFCEESTNVTKLFKNNKFFSMQFFRIQKIINIAYPMD